MSGGFLPQSGAVPIVLADANVLYSRVLRDYVLYAAAEQVISVRWSQRILDEFALHLAENVASFDRAQAQRLFAGMYKAHPYALVEPRKQHYQLFRDVPMPDEDDRHVVAAAVAAEADVLCTNNTNDFPDLVMDRVGIQRVTPDILLSQLATAFPEAMRRVHDTTVASLDKASDESTITALDQAGAHLTADVMADALSFVVVRGQRRSGRSIRTYVRRR